MFVLCIVGIKSSSNCIIALAEAIVSYLDRLNLIPADDVRKKMHLAKIAIHVVLQK